MLQSASRGAGCAWSGMVSARVGGLLPGGCAWSGGCLLPGGGVPGRGGGLLPGGWVGVYPSMH